MLRYAFMTIVLLGCASSGVETEPVDKVRGGQSEAGHPAVGFLTFGDGRWAYCTATLIAPRVLVTAAHCGFGDGLTSPVTVGFGLPGHEPVLRRGLMFRHPAWAEVEWSPVAGIESASFDLAAIVLTEPMEDIEPVAIGPTLVDPVEHSGPSLIEPIAIGLGDAPLVVVEPDIREEALRVLWSLNAPDMMAFIRVDGREVLSRRGPFELRSDVFLVASPERIEVGVRAVAENTADASPIRASVTAEASAVVIASLALTTPTATCADEDARFRYVGYGRTTPGLDAREQRRSALLCLHAATENTAWIRAREAGLCYGDSGGPLLSRDGLAIHGVLSAAQDTVAMLLCETNSRAGFATLDMAFLQPFLNGTHPQFAVEVPATEDGLCSDGQDNDLDGLGDCRDADCRAAPICDFGDDSL